MADPHTLHLDGPTRPWPDVKPVVTMRQATFTPTGPPHFPVPPLSDPPRAPLGDVEDWENGDVIATLKRRPWWRRVWRRRG